MLSKEQIAKEKKKAYNREWNRRNTEKKNIKKYTEYLFLRNFYVIKDIDYLRMLNDFEKQAKEERRWKIMRAAIAIFCIIFICFMFIK